MLDDIIVWWHPDSDDGTPRFDVMPNASNTDRVVAAVGGVETTQERAVLAVQGPDAKERLASIWPEAALVGRFRVAPATWNGVRARSPARATPASRVSRSPCPQRRPPKLWEALVAAGVRPAGPRRS